MFLFRILITCSPHKSTPVLSEIRTASLNNSQINEIGTLVQTWKGNKIKDDRFGETVSKRRKNERAFSLLMTENWGTF